MLLRKSGSAAHCLISMRFVRTCIPLVLSLAFAVRAADSVGARTTTAEGTQEHPASSGPIYVPLGNWVYPVLQRLAAMGYIPDQPSDFGPWTRSECRRQAMEAAGRAALAKDETALRMIRELQAEFAEVSDSRTELRLESLYTRLTGIAGDPLRDSYHFGQTINDDYGRPYGNGFNAIAGFSGYAQSGRFSAYVRGEYQQAPGQTDYGSQVDALIARLDANPVVSSAIAPTHRFEPLEMYVGAKLGFENITFGKQALWWGPDADSAFAFSDNAAPFYMLRFEQQHPLQLPGFLARFAKIRTEFLFGQLSGHQWPPRPYVNAQKVSIDLPLNLELGFIRSAFFGGAGHPLTLDSFEQSFFSTFSPKSATAPDPGDRHSGFDFLWRLPGLKRRVTIYSDSYADDDPNPLDNPKRSAWAPGIYINRLPGMGKMDFRFETYATWLYRQDQGGNFIYWNDDYHDAYTNSGSLLGSWVGRDARAYVASSTYWFSAKSRVQAQYRQIKTGNAFLPGGGTQTDFNVTGQWAPHPEWLLTAQLQGERYWIPSLGPAREDVVAALGVTFYPSNWIWPR